MNNPLSFPVLQSLIYFTPSFLLHGLTSLHLQGIFAVAVISCLSSGATVALVGKAPSLQIERSGGQSQIPAATWNVSLGKTLKPILLCKLCVTVHGYH